MAKRTFPDGFREEAVAYPTQHPEKSMKQCAADLGIGYSTLRRWINEAEEESAAEPAPEDVKKTMGATESTPGSAAAEPIKDAHGEEENAGDKLTAIQPILADTLESMPSAEKAPDSLGESVAEVSNEAKTPEGEKVEQAEDNWEDDVAFSSVGAYTSQHRTENDDYTLRCKSDSSANKDIQHMAGDLVVSMTAQIGNVIEDVGKGVNAVSQRMQLYKKRYELEKTLRKLKKEKEKRQKR